MLVINNGLMMDVRLDMLAIPPCNSPCALAGTCPDVMPLIEGITKPCNAPGIMNRYSTQPELEKA